MTEIRPKLAGAAAAPTLAFAQLLEKCAAAGLPAKAHETSSRFRFASLELPNGRSTRTVRISERRAASAADLPLEYIRFIGDYDAILRTDLGSIECVVRRNGRSGFGAATLARITRAIDDASGDAEAIQEETEAEEAASEISYSEPWSLRVIRDNLAIEISEPSPDAVVLLTSMGATIKISGGACATQAEALATLESYASPFLFDLDVTYGLSYSLGRQRKRSAIRSSPSSRAQPRFPKNRYSADALALYNYGRAAEELPLLEFLAYYQVIEYFFPVFSRDEQIRRLRAKLKDPRFDPNDDVQLGQVLAVVSPSQRGGVSERDQLRSTVRATVDVATLKSFIESDLEFIDHFSRRQTIKGVTTVTVGANPADLRDQVADRIYDIRCRIVHTKQDGGDSTTTLLLPSSKEVGSLGPDVLLVRMVAQSAMIAAATQLA